MRQVPYHLLTSAERKNPAITKSKIDRRAELEKRRQQERVNLAELKKKDAVSVAKMKPKPIVVSLREKVKSHVTRAKKTLPKIESKEDEEGDDDSEAGNGKEGHDEDYDDQE